MSRNKRCRTSSIPEHYEFEPASLCESINPLLQVVSDFEDMATFFSNFVRYAIKNRDHMDENTIRKADSILYEMKRFVDSLEQF